jgi:hypothetical protein
MSIDQSQAKQLAGEQWSQNKWDGAAKDGEGKVSAADWNAAVADSIGGNTVGIVGNIVAENGEEEEEEEGGLGDVAIVAAKDGGGEDDEEEEDDSGLGEVTVEAIRPVRRTFKVGSDGKPLATRIGANKDDDDDDEADEEEEEEDGGLGEVAVDAIRPVRRTFNVGSDGKPLATRQEGDNGVEEGETSQGEADAA